MQHNMQKLRNFGIGLGTSLVLASPAFAAIDTSDVTDALTEAAAAVAVVGAAALVVFVGIKVYKMIRGAL